MFRSILLLTLIALAPLASAGPGASLATLESSEGCEDRYDQYGDQWGSNGSWYAYQHTEWARSCSDGFAYASVEAHDDDGTLVRASVGGEQGNESASTWDWYDAGYPGTAYHSESSTWSYGSWWSRGAAVDTRAGSVGAADGCSSDTASQDWNQWSARDGHSSSGSGSAWSDSSRCGVDAGSDAGGLPVQAWAGEECASSRESFDHGYEDPSRSASFGHETSSGSCGRGGSLDAGGQETSAAVGSECAARSSEYTSTSGNKTFTRAFDASRCRAGLFASGPDGIGLFAGYEEQTSAYCDSETCSDWGSKALGFNLDWSHGPLGPNGVGLWHTLP